MESKLGVEIGLGFRRIQPWQPGASMMKTLIQLILLISYAFLISVSEEVFKKAL